RAAALEKGRLTPPPRKQSPMPFPAEMGSAPFFVLRSAIGIAEDAGQTATSVSDIENGYQSALRAHHRGLRRLREPRARRRAEQQGALPDGAGDQAAPR